MATEMVIMVLNPRSGEMECRGCGYDHWALPRGEAYAPDDFGEADWEASSVSRQVRGVPRKAAHTHS